MTSASKPRVLIVVLGLGCSLWLAAQAGIVTGGKSAPSEMARYGRLQLSFEPNVGQASESVRFVAHASGAKMQFAPSGIVLAVDTPGSASAQGDGTPVAAAVEASAPSTLGLRFLDANPGTGVLAGAPLDGRVNYLMGDDPSAWRTGVPTFEAITYERLWTGVDVSYEGRDGRLKGTYTVAPGADPASVRWAYDGAEAVELDDAGNLQVRFGGPYPATATEEAPVAWQEVRGKRRPVEVRYQLSPDGRVGFAVGAYERSQPLVIDPTLTYSTFLGGVGGDAGRAIAVDGSGNAYVAGSTGSFNFPATEGAYQRLIPVKDPNANTTSFPSAFVAKFNAEGSALVYATYLGGNGLEQANGIWVDRSCSTSCEVYVTGPTTSTNFPTTSPGGSPYQSDGGGQDAFVAKLDGAGAGLVYSTYLGGEGTDRALGIAVDSLGRAVVTGETTSTSFPVTANAAQSSYAGQSDVFVSVLNTQGSGLAYSTYLGGVRAEGAGAVAVGPENHPFVTGITTSTDFPTTVGSFQPVAANAQNFAQPFVTRLTEDGALEYSTYLGSTQAPTGETAARDIAVDATGHAYVVGTTFSSSFPTTPGALQPVKAGTFSDAFVTKLNPAGSALAYSTYLGGSPVCNPSSGPCAGGTDEGFGIAVDEFGRAYVTGSTTSRDFPAVRAVQELATGIIIDLGDFTVGGSANVPDAYVAALDERGAGLLYSTYLGGPPVLCGPPVQCLDGFDQGWDIAVDESGVYATGLTTSREFPTAAPMQSHADQGVDADAFVTKIVDPDGPPPTTTTSTTTTLPPEGDVVADFDGNGDTDVSVFRPSTGQWFIEGGATATWGNGVDDVPVPADYDGDGRDDVAVHRPSNGTWYLQRSTEGFAATVWGESDDIPVPADYDGDGRDDVAVYRPSDGTWYLQQSTAGFRATVWGQGDDLPVPADYDGDGRDDVAVYRPSDGTWYLQQSTAGFRATVWGQGDDIPVPSDYDSDGRRDVAVYRPSNGTWYLQQTQNGFSATAWGESGDVPQPGHYDADGRADMAVYRPSNGTWYLQQSTAGFRSTVWGGNEDVPLPLPAAIRMAIP